MTNRARIDVYWGDAATQGRRGFQAASPADRRSLGQVETPWPVALWMARWLLEGRPRRICDPAVGPGVFIRALREIASQDDGQGQRPSVEAFDVDEQWTRGPTRGPGGGGSGGGGTIRNPSAPDPRPPSPDIRVRYIAGDFIRARLDAPYDAIIANPPYVRHHHVTYGADVFDRLSRDCGRRLSRMTNLYGLFLLKIWQSLAKGGRAAVITPAEWLNADFGVPLKAHLLEQNALDAILCFGANVRVFDDALTTAAITLLRRDRGLSEPIRLVRLDDRQRLFDDKAVVSTLRERTSLDPSRKWLHLFDAPSGRPPLSDRVLGHIASCKRGIATGANDYFVLRESQRRSRGIDTADLRLCITRARQIHGLRLTEAGAKRLIEADEPVWLLDPRPRLTNAVRRYLREGERRGIPRRYLPSHRPEWFRPERRPPAPLLVTVFSRGEFRFVRNEAGVLNLTAYHGVYPRSDHHSVVEALWTHLNGEAGRQALMPHRRLYGGGLWKLEPRDVEAVSLPRSFGDVPHE